MRSDALDAVLFQAFGKPLLWWAGARSLTVLAYHGVDDPRRFEQHLRYLTTAMRPVSLDEVLAAMAGGHALPERAVLVTFDDGERSVLEVGAPLLQRYGVPAVVFVVAGVLDQTAPPWFLEVRQLARRGGKASGFPEGMTPEKLAWALKSVPDERRLAALDELRQSAKGAAPTVPQLRRDELPALEAAGIAVGNHTVTHPCLDQCSGEKITREVADAHAILTKALGHPPRAFAYPNGDEDGRVVQAVARCGYRAAFLFDHRVSPAPPPHPLRISRLSVNSDASLDRFRLIVSGAHAMLLAARRRLQRRFA